MREFGAVDTAGALSVSCEAYAVCRLPLERSSSLCVERLVGLQNW